MLVVTLIDFCSKVTKVEGLQMIREALRNLLKEDVQYQWEHEHEQAFEKLNCNTIFLIFFMGAKITPLIF